MSISPAYTPLAEPYTVPTGDITLRNRLVFPAIPTWSADRNGAISDEEVEFLRRRSRTVGMTIAPPCAVLHNGRLNEHEWVSADESSMDDLRRVAEAIRSGGAKATLQLRHGGRLAVGDRPIAPSAVPAPYPNAAVPSEMSEEEIEIVIEAFGHAARRAVMAGFDAVEIDGGDGSLLLQFFSPHANQRHDQWGGPVENRAAFPIAVLDEVREVVRRSAYRPFAIGYRLVPEEITEPGVTIEETLQLVEGLVACRPDWIHISATDYFAGSRRTARNRRPLAALMAERIRHRTGVMGAGSITTPLQATTVITDGADLVGIGRAMIVDPDWSEKVVAGDEEEIETCLPSIGADETRSIPKPLYRRLIADPDWIHRCPEESAPIPPVVAEDSVNPLEP